jgi:hypothetical protein
VSKRTQDNNNQKIIVLLISLQCDDLCFYGLTQGRTGSLRKKNPKQTKKDIAAASFSVLVFVSIFAIKWCKRETVSSECNRVHSGELATG